MQITEQTPRSEITIQGATFVAPEPFAEGHQLSANEANALNSLLHENLRNNFASKVKAALDEVEGKVDNLNLTELQKEFDAYAVGYEFGVRRVGTRVPTDPVEREALRLASLKIREALRAKNIKVKDLPEGRYDELVEAHAKNPAIVEAAKKNVETTKSLTDLSDINIAA